MTEIPFKRLGSMVRKLHLNDGDILLVKSGTELAKMETLDNFIKTLEEVLQVRILILVVDDFNDLRYVDEKAMYRHGWVLIDHLAELFRRKRGIAPSTTRDEIKGVMEDAQETIQERGNEDNSDGKSIG